jgi:hypothetical protein
MSSLPTKPHVRATIFLRSLIDGVPYKIHTI